MICVEKPIKTHSLEQHKREIHSRKGKIQCEFCPKTYESRTGLVRHNTKHHKHLEGIRFGPHFALFVETEVPRKQYKEAG